MILIIRQSVTFILLEEFKFTEVVSLFLCLIFEGRHYLATAFGHIIIRVNSAGLLFRIPLELAFVKFFKVLNAENQLVVLTRLVDVFSAFLLEHPRVGKELIKSVLILERFVELCLVIRCLQELQLLVVDTFFTHLTDLFKLKKLISIFIAC